MKQRLPLPLLHCMSPVVCVLLLTLAWTLPVEGRKMLMQQQAIFLNEEFGGEGEAGEPAQVADFPTGATLPTDTEVDRILAKVKEKGLHSLTEKEKKSLQSATDRERRSA